MGPGVNQLSHAHFLLSWLQTNPVSQATIKKKGKIEMCTLNSVPISVDTQNQFQVLIA